MVNERIVQQRGEAVTLWRLRLGDQHLHCFLVEPPKGFWLAVERAHELVYSETCAELEPALMKADGLKCPLIVAGWQEIEDD
jgi:hypothetical protein